MAELTLTLLRLGYLALLWIFILAIVGVLRHDVFGTQVRRRGRAGGAAGPAPAKRSGSGRASSATPRNGTPTKLVVTHGPLTGTTLPLGASAILAGRAPSCSLVLDDDYSSSRHARFFPQEDAWWVEDLGSTNGTFVREQRIARPVQLTAGTPVRIGQTVIELRR